MQMMKCQDIYGYTGIQVLNRLRLVCQKQGILKLCAVSDFIFDRHEKQYLEELSKQLGEWEIKMTIIENADENPAVWNSLTEAGNILLVCRLGTTKYRMIDHAANFYLENGIHTAGAFVFY